MTTKNKISEIRTQMARLILLLILFSFSQFSFASKPYYLTTIAKKPVTLFVNTSNDIFFLEKGILERYNSDGTFFQSYGSLFINAHTEICSINSFKTILFSPDFGKIIQLDNRLKEIDVINTYDIGTIIITCVGISYDNNFLWIWDAATQKLMKINKNREAVFTSNTISLLIGKKINPKQIIESGILLYVLDEKNGIFMFDNQGNYIKNIPIPNIQNLKVIEDKIIYTKENCVYTYNSLSFSETKLSETPNLQQLQVGKNSICGFNKDGEIDVWKF